MGRLVEPLSKEQFDKLPPLQKWVSRNYILCLSVFLGLSALAVWANQ